MQNYHLYLCYAVTEATNAFIFGLLRDIAMIWNIRTVNESESKISYIYREKLGIHKIISNIKIAIYFLMNREKWSNYFTSLLFCIIY